MAERRITGMRVASASIMKITTKLMLLGGIVWTAVAVDRRLQRRRAPMGAGDTSATTARNPIVDAELVGISEVDPEGLVQMGEAVDPEALEAAHGRKMR